MRTVKPPRPISKRGRAEQTRARIMDSAYRLFTQQGYEATTVQAVADEAGVAVQTVYFTFHTKAALLMTIESRAVGGEGQEWREQRQRELVEERDPRNVVALWVAASASVLNRITAFVALLGANLQMDAESVERRAEGANGGFRWLFVPPFAWA